MSKPQVYTFGVAKYVYAAAYDEMESENAALAEIYDTQAGRIAELEAESGEYFSRLEVLKDECKSLNDERDEHEALIEKARAAQKAKEAE